MLKRTFMSGVVIPMALIAASCSQVASGTPENEAVAVPEVAHSRSDIEAIVKAYLIENPEVIAEALNVLAEREKQALTEKLSSDSRDVSIGDPNAPITIVEFFDYNCGYCKRSVDWLIQTVENSDGKVRAVFKELPILNEQSREAALAALASVKQDKYMELHQALMKAPANALTSSEIDKIAGSLDINVTKMRKAMESEDILDHIQDIRVQAIENGATATPSFIVNGELIQGFDRRALDKRINTLIEAES